MWIQHLPHQWRISWEHSDDWLDPTVRGFSDLENEDPPDSIFENRFGFSESAHELSFSPVLANRPVVTKLEVPLHLLPGEDVMLYISTPLWIRISMTEPSKVIRDIASFRMSDTWFGPVAVAGGQLGYASQVPAVLKFENVLVRPHCAITAVHVKNQSDILLRLERLTLPMPRLSLFYSPSSGFWTEFVTLERNDDSELADLKLERQPPSEASPIRFVSSPRFADGERNMVFRAFSALFRERGD